jgi:glycosyltransferase involved in cell wall biosynthesis
LVLCGSRNNWIREATFDEAMAAAARLGVADQIHYLGFVPDSDMAPLYAATQALLMPTFFGPTNIPILEAWSLDCPVMTSDIRGVREQAGDAALLVDPQSPEAMADAMARLWSDEALRAILKKRGRSRLALWGPDEFADRLALILRAARSCLPA